MSAKKSNMPGRDGDIRPHAHSDNLSDDQTIPSIADHCTINNKNKNNSATCTISYADVVQRTPPVSCITSSKEAQNTSSKYPELQTSNGKNSITNNNKSICNIVSHISCHRTISDSKEISPSCKNKEIMDVISGTTTDDEIPASLPAPHHNTVNGDNIDIHVTYFSRGSSVDLLSDHIDARSSVSALHGGADDPVVAQNGMTRVMSDEDVLTSPLSSCTNKDDFADLHRLLGDRGVNDAIEEPDIPYNGTLPYALQTRMKEMSGGHGCIGKASTEPKKSSGLSIIIEGSDTTMDVAQRVWGGDSALPYSSNGQSNNLMAVTEAIQTSPHHIGTPFDWVVDDSHNINGTLPFFDGQSDNSNSMSLASTFGPTGVGIMPNQIAPCGTFGCIMGNSVGAPPPYPMSAATAKPTVSPPLTPPLSLHRNDSSSCVNASTSASWNGTSFILDGGGSLLGSSSANHHRHGEISQGWGGASHPSAPPPPFTANLAGMSPMAMLPRPSPTSSRIGHSVQRPGIGSPSISAIGTSTQESMLIRNQNGVFLLRPIGLAAAVTSNGGVATDGVMSNSHHKCGGSPSSVSRQSSIGPSVQYTSMSHQHNSQYLATGKSPLLAHTTPPPSYGNAPPPPPAYSTTTGHPALRGQSCMTNISPSITGSSATTPSHSHYIRSPAPPYIDPSGIKYTHPPQMGFCALPPPISMTSTPTSSV